MRFYLSLNSLRQDNNEKQKNNVFKRSYDNIKNNFSFSKLLKWLSKKMFSKKNNFNFFKMFDNI